MDYEARLSDIIASLPEVSGGFLYAQDRGLYSNQTNGLADDDSLQQVALKLIKIVSMVAVHFQDTSDIRITYKDLILFGTNINNDHWLFLLHQPALSPGMVKMTVQMALNIKTEEAPEVQLPEIPQEKDIISPDNLMEILFSTDSEIKKPLMAIQEQLAQYVGPVAELIFQDSIESWGADSTPSQETLPELISMLEKEIDDEKDRATFRDALKSFS